MINPFFSLVAGREPELLASNNELQIWEVFHEDDSTIFIYDLVNDFASVEIESFAKHAGYESGHSLLSRDSMMDRLNRFQEQTGEFLLKTYAHPITGEPLHTIRPLNEFEFKLYQAATIDLIPE